MKTKGVSIFERMIEKIVLAVALLIFMVVFTLQFLGTPTVDLPGGLGTVPIDQAVGEVENAARKKKAELENARQVNDLPAVPNLSAQLADRFDGPATEPIRIAGIVRSWPAIEDIDDVSTPTISVGDNVYALATPVAPQNTTAAVLIGTVDPSVPMLYPDAQALLPEVQPMDKAFVSVQADWDAAANRARMNASASEGQLVLPQNWRREMEIWDVELVRRELGSDGSWGAETVVPPLPGRPSLREMLENATPPDITTIVAEENRVRAGLRQPRMYNLIAGDFWMAPVELLNSQEIERPDEVERLLRRIRGFRSEIKQIQDQLDNLSGGGRTLILPQSGPDLFDLDAITPESIRWPQFGDYARAQVGGGGGGGGDDRPREDPAEARRRALEQRLERLNTQLQQTIERLNDLGYDDQGNPLDAGDDEQLDYAATAGVSAQEAETIHLWAHDLTAEQGKTYQYAVRVKLRNPLFGNSQNIAEEQQTIAAQPVIASGLSDWSDPVTLPNLSEYFVTAAGDGSLGLGGNSPPSATVEVFRYYYGAWRKQSTRINPGDSLRATIEIPDGLPLYEIARGDNGQLVVEEEGVIEEEAIEFRREGFLLDVVAGVEQAIVTYFRLGDGRIVAHEPEKDRVSERLVMMRLDAESADEQVFRPIDLTDTISPSPQPGRPDPGPGPAPGTPGTPAGPGAPPAGPGVPGSPFG
ncbi:MAG: hypothetical protein ACF8MJ_03790 [Phycisphaerales bacterium JB050]